jgi:hypothetical protein
MPKTQINYTNTNFYKIVCNDLNIKDCYVGHTTDFKRRTFQHKRNTTSQTAQSYNARVYTFIRANGGWDNFDMVLFETRACDNSLEARKIERNIYRRLTSNVKPSNTNKNTAITLSRQQRADNREVKIILH